MELSLVEQLVGNRPPRPSSSGEEEESGEEGGCLCRRGGRKQGDLEKGSVKWRRAGYRTHWAELLPCVSGWIMSLNGLFLACGL